MNGFRPDDNCEQMNESMKSVSNGLEGVCEACGPQWNKANGSLCGFLGFKKIIPVQVYYLSFVNGHGEGYFRYRGKILRSNVLIMRSQRAHYYNYYFLYYY